MFEPAPLLPGLLADLSQLYQAGGWTMYPLTLLLLGALPVGLGAVGLHVGSAKRGGRPVGALIAAVFGVCAVLLGALGRALSMKTTMEAVASINPAEKDMILAEGMAEAAIPWNYGLMIGAPFLVLGGVLFFLHSRQRAAVRAAEISD